MGFLRPAPSLQGAPTPPSLLRAGFCAPLSRRESWWLCYACLPGPEADCPCYLGGFQVWSSPAVALCPPLSSSNCKLPAEGAEGASLPSGPRTQGPTITHAQWQNCACPLGTRALRTQRAGRNTGSRAQTDLPQGGPSPRLSLKARAQP